MRGDVLYHIALLLFFKNIWYKQSFSQDRDFKIKEYFHQKVASIDD